MTKKRGNKEGGLYRRADGMWCASFTIGYDQIGHRKRRVVYGKTKTEVQKKLLELQSASAAGTLNDPKRMRLAEYLKHWLEDVARPSIRFSTYTSYAGIIKLHICPYIGGIQLATLQPAQVQNLYTQLETAGASPRMRQMTHAVLHTALSKALQWGYVLRNVCEAVQRPRAARKTMLCLDEHQVGIFLNAAKQDRNYALYFLALTTGLRQGELIGLQWSDVDFQECAVSIQRAVHELGGSLTINEPKTAKGRRKVTLPKTTLVVLKAHREKMLAEGIRSDWVFCNTQGNLLRANNFRNRSFNKILRSTNLPQIRFHDLRHTAATLLLSQGVHPKIVQERLGHAQIALTLDTYSHVLPSMQQDAADRLEVLFSGL